MSYTLLDTVKSVMRELGSDEIDSISDTVESFRIASVCADVYRTIITEYDYEVVNRNIVVVPSTTLKTDFYPLLSTAYDIKRVLFKPSVGCSSSVSDESLAVNPVYTIGGPILSSSNTVANNWKELIYVTYDDMVALSGVKEDTDIEVYGIYCKTNKEPSYYTVVTDMATNVLHVVLDSYCSEDFPGTTTISAHYIKVIGNLSFNILLLDSSVIPLNSSLYAYYLAECKSQVFYSIKQLPNQKLEQVAQRLGRRLKNTNNVQGLHRPKITYNTGRGWRK